MLNKAKLIEHIQNINRSARRDWLDRFDDASLSRYLDDLQRTQEPRGGQNPRVRQAGPPTVFNRRRR